MASNTQKIEQLLHKNKKARFMFKKINLLEASELNCLDIWLKKSSTV